MASRADSPAQPRGFAGRWWRYQAERFPLAQHAPLIGAFSYSALCYSRLLRTGPGAEFPLPGLWPGLTAFLCCLGFFLQLRIADEHKDFEEDARYRPYRPVPRGLVGLRELTILGVLVGVGQAGAAALLSPRLLVLLGVTWGYFALMSREFFCREWLARRPLAYMLSHMAIMPLIDLFATGCEWTPAGRLPPIGGLAVFLLASYFNGVVIETGRKIRAPEDEEEGVRTYSAVWGRRRAVSVWLGAMTVSGACAFGGAILIGAAWVVGPALTAMLVASGAVGRGFLARPARGAGRRIEVVSGLWVIAMYLSLGIAPAVLRALA